MRSGEAKGTCFKPRSVDLCMSFCIVTIQQEVGQREFSAVLKAVGAGTTAFGLFTKSANKSRKLCQTVTVKIECRDYPSALQPPPSSTIMKSPD